jgi:hypothetical protein
MVQAGGKPAGSARHTGPLVRTIPAGIPQGVAGWMLKARIGMLSIQIRLLRINPGLAAAGGDVG